jgi:diguanylate cyclase (GGDEF)-like protein
MLPSMAVIVAQRRVDQGFLIFAVPILLLYVWRASRVVYTDYWSAVHAREQLEQRARELEQMSSTDTLTQVANRLHFDRQLTQEWARARREGTPIALMMIDVDHFKKVNDEFGHAFGDTCLQAVAVALRAALTRPGDLLARYGGEEFVVMLPGTDSAGARVVAERLHAAVAGLALRYATRSVPVACSIGVQVANGPGLGSPAAALKCADEALYQAKRQGRNRVVFADPA